MRKIDLTKKARKFLNGLPAKQFRQIVKKIFSLLENPDPQDAKQLKGYPYLRTDTGEYRIIYRFDDETVYVLLVGKRNDDEVYAKLRRMK